MKTNKFSQIVLSERDLFDLEMQGRSICEISHVVVEPDLDLQKLIGHLDDPGSLLTWNFPESEDVSVPEFHTSRQQQWHMPEEYRNMDLAAYILEQCQTQEQLQRAGEELLLYQEHDLFDLLRYLKYLVDIMRQNQVIWGVGRGSSVASYVLYLLGVHRVDSMFYDLDAREFLR
jgi:DNA polymerase III alpha subunit